MWVQVIVSRQDNPSCGCNVENSDYNQHDNPSYRYRVMSGMTPIGSSRLGHPIHQVMIPDYLDPDLECLREIERKKIQPIEGAGIAKLYLRLKNFLRIHYLEM